MEKMKKCKACGADIAKSAKICPHCGAKNGGSKIPLIIVIVIVLLIVIAAIGGSRNSTPQKVNGDGSSVNEEVTIKSEEDVQSTDQIQTGLRDYQTILDDYSERIRDAVPGLIEEYNTEATKNTEGLQGLATLSNEKISELAEISNDGISEMAEYYYHTGSGSYDEYEEWAGKLMDVYMEEAAKIQEAYMDSAT